MSFFMKYPPDGDDDDLKIPDETWKPFIIIGPDPEYRRVGFKIFKCEQWFKKTANPLYAIEALRLSTAAKLYPPLWAIDFLNACFQYAVKRQCSLDKAFGFSHEGHGKGKWIGPYEEKALAERNRTLCVDVFMYEGIGLSRSAACDAVASLCVDAEGEEILSGAAVRKIISELEDQYAFEQQILHGLGNSLNKELKRLLLSKVSPLALPKKIRNQFDL